MAVQHRVYLAQSIDGFIAGEQGELDWLEAIDNPGGDDLGFADFMQGVDALVMGRNTFEKVLTFGFWPYEKPVFVASQQLSSLPSELKGKAELIRGSAVDISRALQARGFHALYLDGGQLIRAFLRAGLVDEITLTTLPVILGRGIPLFDDSVAHQSLQLLSSQVLLGQLVKTTWKVLHP